MSSSSSPFSPLTQSLFASEESQSSQETISSCSTPPRDKGESIEKYGYKRSFFVFCMYDFLLKSNILSSFVDWRDCNDMLRQWELNVSSDYFSVTDATRLVFETLCSSMSQVEVEENVMEYELWKKNVHPQEYFNSTSSINK